MTDLEVGMLIVVGILLGLGVGWSAGYQAGKEEKHERQAPTNHRPSS